MIITIGSIGISQPVAAQKNRAELQHQKFRQFFDPIDQAMLECDRGIIMLNDSVKAAHDKEVMISTADQAFIQCWESEEAISAVPMPEMLGEKLIEKYQEAKLKCLASVEERAQYAAAVRVTSGFRKPAKASLYRLSYHVIIRESDLVCAQTQAEAFVTKDVE